MIKLERVYTKCRLSEQIEQINQEAFPPEEYYSVFEMLKSSRIEVYGFLVNETVTGFVTGIQGNSVFYITFLAIRDEFRNQGLGTALLAHLKKIKQDAVLLVEAESPDISCDNLNERKKRIQFYQKAGFCLQPYYYQNQGVEFVVMVTSDDYDFQDYLELTAGFCRQNPSYRPLIYRKNPERIYFQNGKIL